MTGYVRQDTVNNISTGSVVDADDLDGEFNALEAAFGNSTGHTHDGSVGNGAPVTVIGPSQEVIVNTAAVLPKYNDTYDIGTSVAKFKNVHLSGEVSANTVTAAAGLTGTLTGSLVGNASTATTLQTARTLSLSGDATGSATFNGSADATITVAVVDNSHNHTSATVTDFAEAVQDVVGGMVTGTGLSVAYDDAIGGLALNVNDPVITLTGDVTGSATMTNLGNVSITTTVAPNSVALGPDTTGDFVGSLVAGTGVTIVNNTGEGSTPTISIGQPVATNSNVTFNDVVVTGNLTLTGTSTTVNTISINLGDNILTLNSDETGAPSQDAGIAIERGTSPNKSFLWDEANDRWTVGSETMVAGTFLGNVIGAVTGNASTATTLKTARTIALSGDVTGSVSFNGSDDATIAATVVTDGHTQSISTVTGLQTALDSKAPTASPTFTGAVNAGDSITLGSFTIYDNGTDLIVKYGANTVFKITSTGAVVAEGDVTAFGTV